MNLVKTETYETKVDHVEGGYIHFCVTRRGKGAKLTVTLARLGTEEVATNEKVIPYLRQLAEVAGSLADALDPSDVAVEPVSPGPIMSALTNRLR